MAIYLIRHGETDANATRVVQRPEVPLSAHGREQALRLARRLASAGIGRILASDLVRASETAVAVRAATGAPLTYDPLLQERNFGDLRGMPYAELEADIFAPGFAPPAGETWEAFHARVEQAWRRVLEMALGSAGHLAVVTHGLVYRAIETRHASLPDDLDPGIPIRNTALSIVESAPPHAVTRVRCTAHLDAENAADRDRHGRV